MDWVTSLTILLGLLVFFMALGLPVAVAFLGVNIVGSILFLGGGIGLGQLVRNAAASLTNFSLAPIPLFLLMGEILFHSGLAFRAIEATNRLISRVPGRLSVVTVAGGTIFSTLSGSSLANTAMLGSTLLPDMLKRGYHPSIAMGPIMATGGIAMLIPPSALAVLLGSLAGISISQLLIAGIIPGLMMSAVFLAYIVTRCVLNPTLAPAGDDGLANLDFWDRVRPFLIYVVPLFGIFVAVVGSMLAGWATPTESAAIGCAASLVAAACYRSLTVEALKTALMETTKISVMILFIIVASITFSQILSFSGATRGLLALIEGAEVSTLTVLLLMLLVLLFLGAFMDQISMIMVTLPFFVPLAELVGIDLLWLGVMMLICMEVSFMTPPFGLLIFVMKGVAPPHITLRQVYTAAAPFILLQILVLALILAYPGLATWLPELAAGLR
ncbi:TRAP transporter large permease subunit [Fodinicurvata sp. EGI_FJ10296]|uniref:TRAP transporter large permease n=1 Tax=Fodinicurvata sp. EGI_FJ10296 TaxID=3231908 RepID=UPI003453D99F